MSLLPTVVSDIGQLIPQKLDVILSFVYFYAL